MTRAIYLLKCVFLKAVSLPKWKLITLPMYFLFASLSFSYPVLEKPATALKSLPQGDALYSIFIQARDDPETALLLLAEYKESGFSTISIHHQIFFHRSYCEAYLQLEKPRMAKNHINKLYEIGKINELIWVEGLAYYWRAAFGKLEHNQNAIIKNIPLAIDIAQQSNHKNLLANILRLRADFESSQGNHHLAIEDYVKSSQLFEELKDHGEVAIVVSNLSALYIRSKDWDNALKYNFIAESMENKDLPINIRNLTFLMMNRGLIYGEIGAHEKELAAMLKSKEYSKRIGSPRIDANIFTNISDTYNKLKKHDKAIEMANKGMAIATSIGNDYLYAIAKSNRGAAFVKKKSYKKGFSDLLSSLKYFEDNNLELNIVGNLYMLEEAYEYQGQYKKALAMMKKFHSANNKMLFNQRQEKVLQIQIRYESERKEKEIEILKKDNELKASQIAQKELMGNVIVLFSIMSVVILALIYNRYRLMKKLNVKLKESNVELYDQSHKDTLTNLFNRRYISKYLELISPINNPDHSMNSYTLLLLDIDHFKQFNDTYGHDVGDEILVEVANRLKNVTRDYDIVVRWGGEEFLIIAEHVSHQPGYSVADRIIGCIRDRKFVTDIGELDVTISIGYCHIKDKALLKRHWDKWVQCVDKALYEAKNRGRNNYVTAGNVKFT